MIKITIRTDIVEISAVFSKDKADELRTKILSQINNGHAVAFQSMLLNPRYIRFVEFEEVE